MVKWIVTNLRIGDIPDSNRNIWRVNDDLVLNNNVES